MYRSSLKAVGIAAAVVATLLPLAAVAAMKVPTVEPKSVFVTGPNPAWGPAHTNSSTADHREYHKNTMIDLNAWIKENKAKLTRAEYLKALRVVLMQRNHEHRAFHGWDDKSEARPVQQDSTATPPATKETSSPWVQIAPVGTDAFGNGFVPMANEHRYEGNRPSSRMMRDKALVRRLVP